MGKGKGGGKSSSSGKDTVPIKKCICIDPFVCICGNRPERPSRGHKWYSDEQIWGGKGHKQKGASGQVASIKIDAIITEKGQTKVEMWQRLPNQLLQEYCKKEKRPLPIYTNVVVSSTGKSNNTTTNKMYKYKVLLPDPKKDTIKDLQFIPLKSVSNEEQAIEEACLLALLHLQPTIPHERKLPEPYKTTWLNAISSTIKQQQQTTEQQSNKSQKSDIETTSISTTSKSNYDEIDSTTSSTTTSNISDDKKQQKLAQASTHIQLGTSYTSTASKRQQIEDMRQQRNAHIRRHEAIRMANQNHPVFMSAKIRTIIEQLLRTDENNSNDNYYEEPENDDDNNIDDNDDTDDRQLYIQSRLHHEGFTRQQAKTAYRTVSMLPNYNDNNIDNEVEWDTMYEDCLQWLLINLNEDQLPEGFDPRGRTLDVIVPVTNNNKSTQPNSDSDMSNSTYISISQKFGLSIEDSILIAKQSKETGKSDIETFWLALQTISNESISNNDTDTANEVTNIDSDEAISIMNEELETLDAIFGSECVVKNSDKTNGSKLIVLPLENGTLFLYIVVTIGCYPKVIPDLVCVCGTGWSSQRTKISVAVHIELMKFISTLPRDEPMIFSIHSQIQDILHSDNLKEISLIPTPVAVDDVKKSSNILAGTNFGHSDIVHDKSSKETKSSKDATRIEMKRNQQLLLLRPRERKKSFWSVPPNKVPHAQSIPTLSPSLSKQRNSLPAAQARTDFLTAMSRAKKSGRVLLVTGETGSGKSTQLPAYILENEPVGSKIVVTQPRRIAATGVASRVAEERGERSPGVDSVGYVVRGDSAVCDRTRILFCTTGVLLRQLQNEGALECISHIVVDEVHERGLDSDILLGLLKSYLPKYPNLHIVLMSATLDVDRFTNYFDGETPHIHIPGRTFPVTDFTLEDVLSITGFVPPKNRKNHKTKRYEPDVYEKTVDNEIKNDGTTTDSNTNIRIEPIDDIVKRIDENVIDYNLLATLVRHLIDKADSTNDGSILVFLPGVQEINNSIKSIQQYTKGMLVTLLPLHGGLQPKEQSRVFPRAAKGYTKVILSTNVAETSVTIPDCTIVIDCAREKQSSYDPSNRMPLLVDQFASRASLQQRRGRAGRVRSGVCYKLISKRTLIKLKDHSEPEINRVALDQTILQLLFLGVERGNGSFLGTLLDPPSSESIESAIFSLIQLGAVKRIGISGELALSPMGAHLAGIPAPPVIGKMIVMGSILGCRNGSLAMAAGISSTRSPFLRLDSFMNGTSKSKDEEVDAIAEMKQKNVLDERAAFLKLVGKSDHAYIALFIQKWKSIPNAERNRFCDSLGLSYPVMKDISQLYDQLDSSLNAAGFFSTLESNADSNSWRIVQACAVAAMAPGQLVKVQRPAAKYSETSEGAVAKDGEARELKFFIRTNTLSDTSTSIEKELRVYIHPSSINFKVGNYNCPFLVYNSLVTTTKPYLRDITECSTYAMLLFGGPVEVQASKGILVIDGWAELSANARIGTLVGGLRKRVDSLLLSKISNPMTELSSSAEMKLIVQLIKTDGLGA